MSYGDFEVGEYDRFVPRDLRKNIAFRRLLRQECADDDRRRDTVTHACARDPLFWINAFVWTYNPRLTPSVVPMVTYPFQAEAVREIFQVFGKQDAGIEKSRDMGASWFGLLPIDHQFIFGDQGDYMLLSYKADLVDKAGSMKALLPKLDFVHRHLPGWMQPSVRRVQMEMQNIETGSIITGETTTANAGRGGRFKVVFLDEFAAVDPGDQQSILAATADTTQCRLFNSTPNGAGNAYYDLIHRDTTRKIRMHWSQHPDKRVGLYRGTSPSDFELLDADPPKKWEDRATPAEPVMRDFPEDYNFVLDGRLRSIWYDLECSRRAFNEQEIAKELDIDYHSSDYTFFPSELLERKLRTDACEPIEKGTLEFDPESGDALRWTGGEGFGNLWVNLVDGKPPPGRYGVAADIGMGTGATPSTISVIDLFTGQKAADFAYAGFTPDVWAKQFVAVARWFKADDGTPARAIWEANGPGRAFGKKVMEMGLPWVFWRKPEMREKAAASDFAGWWNSQESATLLFNEYRAALSENRYVNRSADSLMDARQYVVVMGGGSAPVHSGSTRKNDPTGARENHGDMVVADALAVKLLAEVPVRREPSAIDPPKNSMAGRLMLSKKTGDGLAGDPLWAVGGFA